MRDKLWIAGTGHRPDKLGGYGEANYQKLVTFAKLQLEILGPARVISGMALGWDQALADAAVQVGIPFTAAIPFAGQESRWPTESQRRYQQLLAKAADTVTVCEGTYAAWKMQKRNEWMVDECSAILALFNGSDGGTKNCVRYAQEQGVVIIDCYWMWLKYRFTGD